MDPKETNNFCILYTNYTADEYTGCKTETA